MKTTAKQELAAVDLILGGGACIAGALFVERPDGSLLGMEVALLAPTPFTDFRLPGLILLGLGALQWATVWVALRGSRSTGPVGLAAALGVLIFMSLQLELIGYVHWSQGVCIGLGLLAAALDVVVVARDSARPLRANSVELALRMSVSGPRPGFQLSVARKRRARAG